MISMPSRLLILAAGELIAMQAGTHAHEPLKTPFKCISSCRIPPNLYSRSVPDSNFAFCEFLWYK